jgi:CBS domain-containing protein
MKDLPVARFMSAPLVVVEAEAALSSATALMDEHGVHHLLVAENGRMAGILSSADFLKLALLAPDPAPALDLRVRDLMQSRVAVLRDTATLRDAARALSLGGFHALPVLATDDTPVGIVTSSDLIAVLVDELERATPPEAGSEPAATAPPAAMPRLLELLRAADVYLRSGQSDQQHARLTRAVEQAREVTVGRDSALGL